MNHSLKHVKIQHGLYKNLPTGTLYNSQAGAIIFALGMAFKVSAVPGMISEYYGSSTFWVYLILSAIEIMLTAAVFIFVKLRGDGFLRATASKGYKACCLVISLWLTAKGTFYFCYSASYLTHELFGGISPSIVYLLLIAPIIFLGIKGARSIGRSCEIFVPVFFALIIFNFAFLDTNMDFGRNLPVFAIEPADFFKNFLRYGLWLGDAIPFAFLRIKNKKLPYLSCSVAVTAALVLVTVLIGVSVYGASLKSVSDLFIRLAGFNKLSLEIGRMEWTHLFSIVAMSILSLSFLYFGCTAALDRAIGSPLPAKIITPAVILCVALFARSTQAVTKFSQTAFGYVLSGCAILIPVLLLTVFVINRVKFKGLYKCLDSEYIPYPASSPIRADSLADNIMTGFKGIEKARRTALANGTLQPEEEN